MHFEEGLGIKVFWVQTICLFPNLLQLVFTALHTDTHRETQRNTHTHKLKWNLLNWLLNATSWTSLQLESYRVVHFWMLGMFLSQLLILQLLPLAVLLVHVLQTFSPLVLLHHLISLELIVAALVIVLQVVGRLGMKTKGEAGEATWFTDFLNMAPLF